MLNTSHRTPSSGWLVLAWGAWLLGAYFAFMRPALLPEYPRYIGSTLSDIHASVPGLAGWLKRVFTVMDGFMAATGVFAVFAALKVVPARLPGAGLPLTTTGLLSVGLMSAVNFAIDSDFKWVLLLPVLLWLGALAAYGNNR